MIILLLIAGTALQIPVAVLFLQQDFHSALLLHAVSVSLLVYSCFKFYKVSLKKSQWHTIYIFSIVLIVFLPGIGFLGALVFLGTLKITKYLFGSAVEDYETLLQESSLNLVYSGSGRINSWEMLQNEVGFEPFVDILMGQDIPIKAKVIRKLSKDVSCDNVKLLKVALQDKSFEVRLYAAQALVKMESDFNERISRALSAVKKNPSYKSYSDLGDVYRMYAETGLVQKSLSKYYWKLAADSYQKSLDASTNHPEILINYIKCLIGLDDVKKAKGMMEHAVNVWRDDSDLIFMNMSINFQLGDFKRIGENFQKINPVDLEGHQKSAYEFWVEDPGINQKG